MRVFRVFHEAGMDNQIVQQLVGQLSWEQGSCRRTLPYCRRSLPHGALPLARGAAGAGAGLQAVFRRRRLAIAVCQERSCLPWSALKKNEFAAVVTPHTSRLLASITDRQLELPAFECHQHAPELIPGDFPAIHDDERNMTILRLIPIDTSAHRLVDNLRKMLLPPAPWRFVMFWCILRDKFETRTCHQEYVINSDGYIKYR